MIKYPSVPLARVGQKLFSLTILAIAISSSAQADVKLSALFSDHMVLQRGMKMPIWGWADPNEEITVTFGTSHATTKAGSDGKWKVYLDPSEANAQPQTLTVVGKNSVKFTDILVGDVWVCSGQSNMGLYVGECSNAAEELPKARDPLLRMFTVSEHTDIHPQEDVVPWPGAKTWEVSSPESASHFSGVGYFFGRELRKSLQIPIGLLRSVQGGSKAQLWISVGAIEKQIDADPEFKDWMEKRKQTLEAYPQRLAEYLPLKAQLEKDIKRWNNEVRNAPEFQEKMKLWEEDRKKCAAEGKPYPPRPQPSEPRPKGPDSPDGGPYSKFMVGNLYNAMIAPLTPFAIKGVIWYQGESNDDNSKQYHTLFPILIKDWREKWGQGNFPFLFVQLPNIRKPATEPVQNGDHWPVLREAQAKALSLPNTGMATTIDIGDPYDVHGKDKIDVGVRLSRVARHLVYGENIVFTGPAYDSMNIKGNKAFIHFKNAGSGLVIDAAPWTPSGKLPEVASELKGFAIAGEDKKWEWARAEIQGDQVVVSSERVPHPVAVRYGWADNPPCNLYNKEKLPAAPFRTDDWD